MYVYTCGFGGSLFKDIVSLLTWIWFVEKFPIWQKPHFFQRWMATSRSSLAAFAAIRCDGAVITWGSRPHGGENPEGRLFSTETLVGWRGPHARLAGSSVQKKNIKMSTDNGSKLFFNVARRHTFVFVVSLSLWYSVFFDCYTPINHDVMQSGANAWRLCAPVAVANQTSRHKLSSWNSLLSHVRIFIFVQQIRCSSRQQLSTSFKQKTHVQRMNNYKFKIHLIWTVSSLHAIASLCLAIFVHRSSLSTSSLCITQFSIIYLLTIVAVFLCTQGVSRGPHAGSREMSKGFRIVAINPEATSKYWKEVSLPTSKLRTWVSMQIEQMKVRHFSWSNRCMA